MIRPTQCVQRKQYNSYSRSHTTVQSNGRERSTAESEVTKRPGSRVFISPGSPAGRLAGCLKRSIALRVRTRDPRLEAVIYPASGSASGPASRPSPRSGTPISCALPVQTSHEHVGPWVVSNNTKIICLRGSSDGANQFISVTAPSYTTFHLFLQTTTLFPHGVTIVC